MSSIVKITVTLELELVSGPEQDAETLVDAFAAKVGRENTAKPPLEITAGRWDDAAGDIVESVYVVKLVDDR
jgi:hypothetical protein